MDSSLPSNSSRAGGGFQPPPSSSSSSSSPSGGSTSTSARSGGEGGLGTRGGVTHSNSNNPSTIKSNLKYLINPKSVGGGTGVSRPPVGTRATLRSLRYVFKFVFWRLLRYAKYAAVAAGATALAGTTLGVALPWVAAIAVPSVPVAAAIGLTTAVIKFGWRHRGNHFRQGWLRAGEGRDARADERNDAEDAEREFSRPQVHPRAKDAWSSEGFA